MFKALRLAGIIAVLPGCTAPTASWKGTVTWPDETSTRTLVEPMEAGAALAAAGAIREVVSNTPFPNLFAGCSSPEQGLDVSVFADQTPGLYFVVVEQRFDRCGGPSGRVLDWWEVYAVTAQGVVVAKAPVPNDDISAPETTGTAPAAEPAPTPTESTTAPATTPTESTAPLAPAPTPP